MSVQPDFAIFVGARPQIMDSVLKLLDESKRLKVVGTAFSGEECIERLQQTEAGIALIDFCLPQISGVKVIEYLSSKHPDVVSVLLSDEVDYEYFRSGMLAGAREFIVLPVEIDELELSIERVVRVAGRSIKSHFNVHGVDAPRPPDGRVIVFGSGKGGVGLSFIAANMAKLMADRDPSINIAAVDLNYRANDLASIANIEPTRTLKDLVPVISELDMSIIGSVAQSVGANFDVFAAPSLAELHDLFDSEQLRGLVAALRDSYDAVLIDSGVHIDAVRAGLYEIADLTVIVLTPEILAIRGTRRFIDSLERFGISKNNMLAVINRWVPSNLAPERISEYIGIPISEKLLESEIVRTLLDEGRLIRMDDRNEAKDVIDRLASTAVQKLSLGEGAGVA